MTLELQDIRKEYQNPGLSLDDLAGDPIEQFQEWLETAVETGLAEPNSMCLATANAQGEPSTRVVLLKFLSAQGLTFFTNYTSRKALDIESNSHVSVNFTWLALQRQVNIAGIAERISRQETIKYFLSRPIASQLGAWSSPQSQVISSRAVLETTWSQLKHKYAEGVIPTPDHWGGYRIVPTRFEFWQGGKNRLHDRFRYCRRETGEWTIERLAP